MALIQWKESYSVGVDLLDSDHKLLISLINQLSDAMASGQARDVVGSVLNVLIEYTETHFGREELCMEKGGYPDIVAHKKEHERLCAQVHDIIKRYHEGQNAAVDKEVLDFLKNWLTGHILGVDMKYRSYLADVTLTPEELLRSFRLEEHDDEDVLASLDAAPAKDKP